MTRKLLILTAFLLLPCAACAAPGKPAAPKEKAAYVKVITAKNDAVIRQGFTQNTSLEAIQRVVLYPRVTGRLDHLNVTKGMDVIAGELVAELVHAEQDAQIAAAEASVVRTRAEMENTRIELQRYQRLKNEGFSTQQQLDSKNTAYRSARAQYDAARADLERLKVTRGEYLIKASIDGTVLNDYSLTPGAMLSTSSPVVELANLEELKAVFRIPENRFFSVRPGMSVLLRMNALPDEEFRAQVVRVDDYLDPQTRTAGVEAVIKNETTGSRLRPGMFGQAFVVEKEAVNTFAVPLSALRKGEEENSGTLALHKDGKAEIVSVKTGIRQGLNVQITEGLKNGDQVIVFGGSSLSTGDPVSVVN
ncbi:MAG: efflux RND transporter periplasmic adaptor subunit [Pyramidobacter sp.]|nr:efflux RND transporter periplasmic adaptor subunit [Pyramidobacter sp.]